MIRATEPPVGENLAKLKSRCKMFHVEQNFEREIVLDRSGVPRGTLVPLMRANIERVVARMFPVEHESLAINNHS